MALTRADNNQPAPDAPLAGDYGDSAPAAPSGTLENGFDVPAENAAQAPATASQASSFGAKPKSQDTFVKFALSEGGKEMWLKQTTVHENGVREFSDTRSGYTAFMHPRDAFIFVYKTADAQNYMLGFRDPNQKKGVVARLFVAHTRASTPDNPKTWVGCKVDETGLFDADGKLKQNATQVFGTIVGKESVEVKQSLLDNAARLKAAREQSNAAQNNNAPLPEPSQQQNTTPVEQGPKLVADQELTFTL